MNEAQPAGVPGQTDPEAAKAAALRRTKALATGSLVLCAAIFLTARAWQGSVPALAYVAAFAEAAVIGGLADWYAVVALFRRPLGLPIPHTAIIPRNQERIADNLGLFIQNNFLAPEPVRLRLREIDFASFVADWLSDAQRADRLSALLVRLVPQALKAVEGSQLKSFLAERVRERIDSVDLAPLAAELLSSFTAEKRHQRLFDEMLKVFARFLDDPQALASLRDKIRQELPTLANLFRADTYLLKKIVASAASLMNEAREDPDHPMRAEFDAFVKRFVARLRHSPDYARRAEALKNDLLARPEFGRLAEDMWKNLSDYLERDAAAENSALRRQLASMLAEIGRQMQADPAIKNDVNEGFVQAISSIVDSQKHGVGAFISAQVRSWDLGQMTRLVELNIGRDLQYIRFNGMIIGGLAGLTLHILEATLFTG